jgi:hypothetical protein
LHACRSTLEDPPFFLSTEEIKQLLEHEIPPSVRKTTINEVHFYGAGINSTEKKNKIIRSIRHVFYTANISAYSDIEAAAKATCQHNKGIVCILGTGSNTAFYNGKKIQFKTKSLGYILGDEGGGTHLGKKVLQYYLHEIFEEDLMNAFKKKFPFTDIELLNQLYQSPLPNRFLAQFAQFIIDHRGHYMIENIAEDCLNDLFLHHLIRYPNVHKVPVHFVGSVAWHLKDILKQLAIQYEINMGSVIQKPIDRLLKYHVG